MITDQGLVDLIFIFSESPVSLWQIQLLLQLSQRLEIGFKKILETSSNFAYFKFNLNTYLKLENKGVHNLNLTVAVK